MLFITKLLLKLKLNAAIRKAEQQHAKTGQRYYVLPTDDGRLMIMNRKEFRFLKRKGYIDYKAKVTNILRESVYYTAYPNGDGKIDKEVLKKKTQMYIRFVERIKNKK